jgi:hypothetical protein
MITRTNPVFCAVASVLDRHGIAFELQHRGKHPRVLFTHGGRMHRVVVPASPSDRRAPLKAKAFIRRILRQETCS